MPFIGRAPSRRSAAAAASGTGSRTRHAPPGHRLSHRRRRAARSSPRRCPYFSINAGIAGSAAHLPDNESAKQGFRLLDQRLPLGSGQPGEDRHRRRRELARGPGDRAAADGDRRPTPSSAAIAVTSQDGRPARHLRQVAGDPAGEAQHAVVTRLRDDIVPPAFDGDRRAGLRHRQHRRRSSTTSASIDRLHADRRSPSSSA